MAKGTTPTRRRSGHALVWLLVVLALFGALMAAALGEEETLALTIAAACVAVAALGVVWEFRRDGFEAARSTAQLAFLVAFFASLPIFLDGEPAPLGVWAVSLGAVALGVGCWVYRALAYHAKDRLPNLLLERFDRARIRECGGIQFVAWADKNVLTAGERLDIHVMAQSCWDEPRRLAVQVAQEGIGRKWQLIHEPKPEIEIAAGEVVLMTVPVLSHPMARGSVQIGLVPEVSGRGGTRVRRFRARAFEGGSTSSALWTALLLSPFVAMLVQGAGIRLSLRIRKGDKSAEPPEGPLPMEVASLYAPEPTELKAIAMGVIG